MNYERQFRPFIDELEFHGAKDITLCKQGRHPRLLFTWKGRGRFLMLSKTPSDNHRGLKNCMSDLRKLLGVKRPVSKKNPDRRRKIFGKTPYRFRNHKPVGPIEDPWLALIPLKQKFEAANE